MNRQFDKLNSLDKRRSLPYEQYFGEMPISDDEKEKRISMAEDIDDIFYDLFLLIQAYKKVEKPIDTDYLTDYVVRRYEDVLSDFDLLDYVLYPWLAVHLAGIAADIIQTTDDNLEDPWYLSDDRVMLIAENEANSVEEYALLRNAINNGATKKTWVTMQDHRVRHTHHIVDGETIGIHDAFQVGAYEMMQPKDTSLGAGMEEIANCRCSLMFM